MQMQGERTINAGRAEVWHALNDAEVLKACIPGCDELEKTSPTSFEATVTQKVGPVKVRFKGAVELSDIVEAESYTITGEGKGGAAGFAKGGAKVRLEDAGQGTLLVYEAEARVGGKLAQLGSRLIDGFAKKMADDFFTRFQEAVEGPAEEPTEESPETPEAEGEAPEEKKKGWFKRLIG
jgi:carbon monoxide dehydrogenase subunit G